MAADNRSIVITLKLDGNQDNSQANPTNTEGTKQQSDNDGNTKAVASFAIAQTAQLVSNEIVAWADYYWERELTLNDDYISQRSKTIALTHISRVTGAVSNVGSMTATGAMVGGTAGAIVGAIIGVVTEASRVVRSNIQGQDQQNIAIRQMNAQLEFTRSRAGWSLQAASIGEDL